MYPYIALLWDATMMHSAAAAQELLAALRELAPDYRPVLSEPGCTVLHDPPPGCAEGVYHLRDSAGVILGRIFPAEGWHLGWSWTPSAFEATEIIRTQGQWLKERVWGNYIAFLRDRRRDETRVIRDCSGGIPCYRLRQSHFDMFFSDPMILRTLRIRPALNWNYVLAFLCSSQMQVRDTALEGVTELLAGDGFRKPTAGDGTYYCAWDPLDVIKQPLVGCFGDAVGSVRAAACYCIGAWASVYESIIHNLSGGLDSAVVLACLAKSPSAPVVTCVNRFGIKPAEDERAFARLAASMGGFSLIEIPIFDDSQVIDDALTHLPLTSKPTVSGTLGVLEASLLDTLSDRICANSIWTGQGGDHLFLQTPLPFGPVDYAALRGFGPGLLRSLRDAVHLSGLNYWETARLLWRKDSELVTRAFGAAAAGSQPFVVSEARSHILANRLSHPWIDNATSLPPGQRLQIAALSEVLNRHRPLPGLERTYKHHPLLSQPLVELCLRIPSYLHLHGGIDRAVERAAFADLIPERIATRRQKGQSTFSILEIIHRSSEYVRNLLLDGVLAREGILDRVALDPLLTGQRPVESSTCFPLVSCIAAELWIRTWINHGQQASCPHSSAPGHSRTPIPLDN